MERMATRGFGAKKIAAALGLPQSTTKRWLQRLRWNGDMASRKIVPKTLKTIPLAHFFRRPSRKWWKNKCKNEGARNFEKYFFRSALFPVQEAHGCKTVAQTRCIFGPSTGVFHLIFLHTPTLMFSDPPKKGGLKPRKTLEIWLPRRNFDPPDQLRLCLKFPCNTRVRNPEKRRAFHCRQKSHA